MKNIIITGGASGIGLATAKKLSKDNKVIIVDYKDINQDFIQNNFEDSNIGENCSDELVMIKNRLCCPKDKEPLITLLDKKVESYKMKITCKLCESIYNKVK